MLFLKGFIGFFDFNNERAGSCAAFLMLVALLTALTVSVMFRLFEGHWPLEKKKK